MLKETKQNWKDTVFIVTNRTGDLDDEKLAVINGYVKYLFDKNVGFDVIYDNTVELANDLRTMSIEEYNQKVRMSSKSRTYSIYKHYYEYSNPNERVWLEAFAKYMNSHRGSLTAEEARRASYTVSYLSLKYDGMKGIQAALESGQIPKTDADRRWLSYLRDFAHESAGMIDIPALDSML